MSGNNQKAQQSSPARQAETELESLRSEVAILRKAIGSLAWLMLEPVMRAKCDCGAIACRTVTASKRDADGSGYAGSLNVKQCDFKLCDECKLPEGWIEGRRVELSADYRETVRIANKLCPPRS